MVLTQKQELDDAEDKNLTLKRELESKMVQLEKLSFINNDFKEKANIGMLEFLELELKNKENQLASLHSRLDEKQKEYVSKLENYQNIFNENRARIKELEEENFQLQKNPPQQNLVASAPVEVSAEPAGEGETGAQIETLKARLATLEGELSQEKEKSRRLREDIFREKGAVMQLEIKTTDLETQNIDLKLKIGDLEHKLEESDGLLQKMEAFGGESDTAGRMNKLFALLSSLKGGEDGAEGLSSHVEKCEGLLKEWIESSAVDGASKQRESQPEGGDNRASEEELVTLRRDCNELRRQYKSLKQSYIENIPNPSESLLKSSNKEGTDSGSSTNSSLVAQQLLKKVLIYEENNNLLRQEKKQLLDKMVSADGEHREQMNILYSIGLESLGY